ncbi:hypothetical protein [Occallatibacter savannae]|uniref:hypothetical protein n=1 Tax=Occallatibacter savannae TaxID=1002691 RepID=UPI000D688DA1|nr:hypothetical protein [Occallatibacter savannae]
MTALAVSAAKVIATGFAGDGQLRATVILTPPTSAEDNGPSISKLLQAWPLEVIQWLCSHGYNILLKAGAEPQSPSENNNLIAHASAMASLWGSDCNPAWVQRLWEQIFSCGTDGWGALAAVLREATSQGDSTAPMPDHVKGVPQTDLSLALECNRALELCNSVKAVSEKLRCKRVEARQEEIKYLPLPSVSSDSNPSTQDIECESSLHAKDYALRDSLAAQVETLIKCYQRANAPDEKEPTSPPPPPSATGGGSEVKTSHQVQTVADFPEGEKIRHIFYALQSSPTLSRLFGLVIDVTLPASSLKEAPVFFYLSVCSEVDKQNSPSADSNQKLSFDPSHPELLKGFLHPIYVLTQYDKSDSTSFWPATTEESKGASSRWLYRGVAVNTDWVMEKNKTVNKPRFELSSLDVRRAAEAAIDRESILRRDIDDKDKATDSGGQIRELQNCGAPLPEGASDDEKKHCADLLRTKGEDLTCRLTTKQLSELVSKTALRPAALARKTYHTGGFTLLDRHRGDQGQAQRQTRDKHKNDVANNSPIVLCANDLLTGYRVDVGVPTKAEANLCKAEGSYQWRCLMARRVVYGNHGHASQIDRVAPRLFIEGPASCDPEMGWRTCLEDGYHGLTARVIKKTATAHAEEALFAWAAEPMGAPTSGTRDDKVTLDPIGCGRLIIAPSATSDAPRRIPPLRFGSRYVFALRAVFPGGISLPLAVARKFYNRSCAQPVALIPACVPSCSSLTPVRRFLRHERIDAPWLLLPEEVAMRRHGPMGYESAAHAIVRRVFGEVHEREQPTFTQRIFVAPGVSHALAAMHGVFDQFHGAYPPEGLSASHFGPSGVRRDPLRGGFPMIVTDHITGINGYPYPAGRHTAASALGDAAEAGDMLYSFAPHAKPNRGNRDYVSYYPDPAACAFVIGVRFAGTDTYLKGRERVIDALAGGYRFPDTRPLLLTVARTTQDKPRTRTPLLEEIVSVPGDTQYHAHRPSGAGHVPGAVEALVLLAPGDDFEIDVWCIPSKETLANRLALLESLSALCLQAGAASDSACQAGADLKSAFLAGVQSLLPSMHDAVVANLAKVFLNQADEAADWKQAAIGPAGLTIPGPKVRQALGTALFDFLTQYPLDEIAAVRTLRASHATDRPFLQPRLLDEGPGMEVCLKRTPGVTANTYPWTPQGKVDFDWSTTSSLELTAAMASPTSDRLDDVRRGRSLLQRRHGLWPKDIHGNALSPSRVYGFHVDASGEVTLCKTEGVALYRLDDIPVLDRERFEKDQGMSSELSLSARFQSSSEPSGAAWVGTGKYTFQFTDGLARQLLLSVKAYARHRDRMRTADPDAHNGKWLHQGKPLTPEQGSLSSKDSVPVWLPSSVRPAEPATRTPFPLFRLSQEPKEHPCAPRGKKPVKAGNRLSRTVIIRIPISRPWFSSGEDERLGIVLWPPQIFDHAKEDLERNYIWLKTPPQDRSGAGSDRRWLKVEDFRDEDLGPGGKFITRWGGDPTRLPAEHLEDEARPTNTRTTPSLIPPEAFLDLYQPSETGFIPEKISNVLMPIRADEDSHPSPKSRPSQNDAVIQTLAVSLLTYRPKFDISEEQWYVDTAIEHPFEAEPFVRLGLVRYQPHAEEPLRVSYPVVQWTQLLPRRTVEVQRSGRTVTVQIEGLATAPSQSELDKTLRDKPRGLLEDAEESFPVSQMVARIVREEKCLVGVPTRILEYEQAFKESEIQYTQHGPGRYQAVWCKKMDLERFDSRLGKYYVIVEERDMRLPATYPNEPVSPAQARGKTESGGVDASLLVQSGIRFSVKMLLK